MRATILSISALLAATVFLQVGGGLLGTTVGLRMAVAEFPALVAGAVVSVYFLGYVLGVFYGSRLIEAVGHIRAFAALASVASAATLLHPFLVAPVPWGGLRFVQGFCLAGLAVCTESWLNDRVSNEVRGRILSIYMIHIYTAQGIGQVLLNVPDSTGFGLFVISSVLLSLAGVFLGLHIFNMPFGILMTGIGCISLAGVVVNNAIVLLDFINQLRARGHSVEDAIVEAGITRFRPVMLTAVTTILGLIPMATGVSFDFFTWTWIVGGESSQWWGSMAVAVIFGLAFATVLTLIVVPALYSYMDSLASVFAPAAPHVAPTGEQVPAKSRAALTGELSRKRLRLHPRQ